MEMTVYIRHSKVKNLGKKLEEMDNKFWDSNEEYNETLSEFCKLKTDSEAIDDNPYDAMTSMEICDCYSEILEIDEEGNIEINVDSKEKSMILGIIMNMKLDDESIKLIVAEYLEKKLGFEIEI